MNTGPVTIGVLKETAPGERRVALVPDSVARLVSSGISVLIERGAGADARLPDDAYTSVGALVVDGAELDLRADILVCVQPPDPPRIGRLRRGRMLVGLLGPVPDGALLAACDRAAVTAVNLDLLPRTLSRAQAMDALSSQANFAGYKAVLIAASAYESFFPMMVTAAGSARPAQVLVLGAGVAGLSAIGTARRLGAVVTGYDIRPEAADDVRSMGARFLDLSEPVEGAGAGGYARELSADERARQQAALQEHIRDFDVVITTAQVPGRRPPVLVTTDALKAMRPGSVVVDLAVGPLGGNVEGAEPGRSSGENGVTVIGAADLPASMAAGASAAYSRNIATLTALLIRDGAVAVDLDDEVLAAVVAAPHSTDSPGDSS